MQQIFVCVHIALTIRLVCECVCVVSGDVNFFFSAVPFLDSQKKICFSAISANQDLDVAASSGSHMRIAIRFRIEKSTVAQITTATATVDAV